MWRRVLHKEVELQNYGERIIAIEKKKGTVPLAFKQT